MVAVGYAQGGVAGVSDWPSMLAAYPSPSCMRVFIPTGTALPAWSSSYWSSFPTSTVLIISWKVWPFDIDTWLDALPAAREGKVCLTYWHEPEQADDPPVATYRANFDAFLAAIADHPKRALIKAGPIYTAAWAGQEGNDWRTYWTPTMQAEADFIGWDVYNRAGTIPSNYPEPLDPRYTGITLKIPIASALEVGKPYLVGEFGSRRTAADTTGTGCVAWMRSWVEEMHRGPCSYAAWWHDSGNDLLDLNRTAEIAELQSLVAAYTVPGDIGTSEPPPAPEPEPDPISFVADGQNINVAAATSLTVAAPVGIADGDFLLGWYGWLSTTVTASQPADFNVLGSQVDGTTVTGRLMWRVAASEPATYAFGVSSAVKSAAWIGAYRGLDPAAPIYDWALAAGVEGTSHTTPAVDVPAGGWLVYGAVTRHTPGGTGATTWTSSGTAPQERYEAASNAGSADITFVVYDSGTALDAATGVTRTLTSSQSEELLALFAIALKPEATPPVAGGGETTAPTPGIPVA